MNKEIFYISLFNNKYIGDDGAYIGGKVYSADAFCENVHFKREWMSFEQIAYKAMLVNISDAIAMNAEPRQMLVSVVLPKHISPFEMEMIARGLKKAAREFGIEIIGGDTIASDRLDFHLSLISETKRPIFRKPLKETYLLAYTGKLGSVRKDLKKLLRGGKVSKRSKFIRPRLRREFMKKASRHIKTAMDISDGLFDDLAKMCRLNKKGVRFFKKIPRSVGCSGEEYELLFAFDKRDLKKILQISKITRTPVTVFAKAIRKPYKNICKPNHF
ncbi:MULTISPECIES: thiamine-phosphate kinase [unclassified Nitratiruptor]|uniref:thiamine-phosphate kinase n=1 Tax=unclassified Nitratiruptor TaxID=2624044 RepID=UPI0019160854|nr:MULTISPECIES: thiamine-phosphate kinase [unclassified Nitratiruptor]BCD59994.1 thiamine-monophosphate kinase [Nitratiruptor sp. YY08-10]BCD63917.1 thiamine-monophosphate kinase [Nitratiruptor sp. YY08-14]